MSESGEVVSDQVKYLDPLLRVVFEQLLIGLAKPEVWHNNLLHDLLEALLVTEQMHVVLLRHDVRKKANRSRRELVILGGRRQSDQARPNRLSEAGQVRRELLLVLGK